MTAMYSANCHSFSCCSTAVAGTSVRHIPILDTADRLVVSICILPLLRILARKA